MKIPWLIRIQRTNHPRSAHRLYNRRYLDNTLDKKYNDRYGHQAGDSWRPGQKAATQRGMRNRALISPGVGRATPSQEI